jgi:hypothetical protein
MAGQNWLDALALRQPEIEPRGMRKPALGPELVGKAKTEKSLMDQLGSAFSSFGTSAHLAL